MIHEPVTVLTDFVLGGLYGAAGGRLVREGHCRGARSERLWGWAFVALAVAAFSGGTVHGVPHWLGDTGTAALWTLTLDAIGVAMLLFALAVVSVVGSPRAYQWARVGGTLVLAGFVARTLRYDAFAAASTLSVAVMAVAAAILGRRGHTLIAAGMGVAFAGASLQRAGVALHTHFNHNDLYHVIQMVSAALLYRGGRRLP